MARRCITLVLIVTLLAPAGLTAAQTPPATPPPTTAKPIHPYTDPIVVGHTITAILRYFDVIVPGVTDPDNPADASATLLVLDGIEPARRFVADIIAFSGPAVSESDSLEAVPVELPQFPGHEIEAVLYQSIPEQTGDPGMNIAEGVIRIDTLVLYCYTFTYDGTPGSSLMLPLFEAFSANVIAANAATDHASYLPTADQLPEGYRQSRPDGKPEFRVSG